MPDKFHDECGVFGILDHKDAANLVYLGLYALQHRGQESAGIAAADPERNRIIVEKEMGYVADVFTEERLKRLPGRRRLGMCGTPRPGARCCATRSRSWRRRTRGRSPSRTTGIS